VLSRMGKMGEAKQAARRTAEIIDERNKKDALVEPK